MTMFIPAKELAYGSPRVRIITFAPRNRSIYDKRDPCSIGLWPVRRSCPHVVTLYEVSVRWFGVLPAMLWLSMTSGCLRIPSYVGHPCLRLTIPTAKFVRDFHPQVITHAGYTKKSSDIRLEITAFERLISTLLFSFLKLNLIFHLSIKSSARHNVQVDKFPHNNLVASLPLYQSRSHNPADWTNSHKAIFRG
jgi:hypothetical protein